jgi:hypothetical protein
MCTVADEAWSFVSYRQALILVIPFCGFLMGSLAAVYALWNNGTLLLHGTLWVTHLTLFCVLGSLTLLVVQRWLEKRRRHAW